MSMKLRTAAVWALLGMVGSSAAAMNVPLRGGGPAAATPLAAATPAPPAKGVSDPSQPRFHADKTLALDARLGHATIARSGSGETFLLASIAGTDRAAQVAAPMNLAIVLDRSGSMRGVRLANAVTAATGIVERMRDGDRVTVVTFDDFAQVVVPPTLASATTRPAIESAIRAVRAGGDTCLSCGLEAAMRELDGASALGAARGTGGEVDRAILLSDGAANRGVRDVAGLRAIAGRMRDRGCAVSTIGLDVDFDEKVMAAIASESNGHHYFVADAADLGQVFDHELDALLATVARDAELVIAPAPGVSVVEVFDRAFRREGDRVVVPLGTFGTTQEKTALLRVHIPTDTDGVASVASLSLRWRDLVSSTDEAITGTVSLAVTAPGDAQKDVDPFVAARLERSRTARALTDANALFEQGRREEARRKLSGHVGELQSTAAHASAVARAEATPRPPRAPSLDADFADQLGAISAAQSSFAEPPPQAFGRGGGAANGVAASPPAKPQDSRAGKAGVRTNQSKAVDLGL